MIRLSGAGDESFIIIRFYKWRDDEEDVALVEDEKLRDGNSATVDERSDARLFFGKEFLRERR